MKVDVTAGVAIAVSSIIALLIMLFNLIAMWNISLPMEITSRLVTVNLIIMAVAIALIIGVLVFAKVKFPYCSGKNKIYKKSQKNK